MAIFPLHAVGPHILMAVHVDGTVALWHTLRRLLMETASVRKAFPTGRGEMSLASTAIDNTNRRFVFADDRGNIHVCSLQLEAVHDKDSLRPARVPQSQSRTGRPMADWPGTPFSSPVFAGSSLRAEAQKEAKVAEQTNKKQQPDGAEQEVDEEKTPYIFKRFCQDHVFHCGFSSVSGVCIVDAKTMRASGAVAATSTSAVSASPKSNGEAGRQARASWTEGVAGSPLTERCGETLAVNLSETPKSPLGSEDVIVVSSGSDNFTRVFTLDGMSIGECGMNTWVLGKESTYEFLGVKPTKRLPAHNSCVESVDFLQGTPSEEKTSLVGPRGARLIRTTLRAGKPHGELLSTSDFSVCRSMADTQEPGAFSTTQNATATAPPEVNQVEFLTMQPLGAELREWAEVRQPPAQSQECPRPRFLPQAKAALPDEAVTLSTHIRSRRLREGYLYGLVKNEFIPKLRGLPSSDTEEDSSVSRAQPGTAKSPKFGVRVEQSSESSLAVSGVCSPNSENANNKRTSSVNAVAVDSNLPEEVSTSLASRSHAPPVFVPGGTSSHPGRAAKTQAGTVAWKWESHATNDKEALQPRASSAARQSVAFTNTTPSLEEECRRQDLIQEHLEAQRRMLLSLGRADPVLEALVPRSSPVHSSGAFSEAGKMGTGTQLSATRRTNTVDMMETRDRIARITSRLRLSPIAPIPPPSGIGPREDASSLRDGKKDTHRTTRL
ncbi:putative WD40 repeat protein [Trypanosoma conorhini]|uniref:Putative WD40 repeat protein n=1 Tax=Trypanosoma conorhini TaxID=83891 RepID=A0A3R7N676_9TRYP|nr:putative WD40 repeat protein [Trypanosoma conorhini]RNF26059.1 putative WD40 repeat protein [Trypanosoma conorhini]